MIVVKQNCIYEIISDGVSRPDFGVFASLGLEGFRSRLDTLTITKKWYSKIFIIQQFLFVVFAGKKQPKQYGKMPEI